jgi:RNA polymerase sigma-70 factor (ECF subfamily)
MANDDRQEPALLSDEPTLELIVRSKTGDVDAANALLERCLPTLKRWAHGRLPSAARGALDTDDIVQNVAMRMMKRLDQFEPRHVGAMQGYLRRSVINRIRDEVRRVGRQPPPVELPEDQPSDRDSPLETAIQAEAYDRYRDALSRLRPKDRELVVARIELQWSIAEISHRFDFSTEAARMAVTRALRRLAADLGIPR